MWSGYAAPDHTNFRALNLPLRLVNEGNTLAKVKLSILLGGNTLYLYQRSVRSCVAFGALMAQDAAFAVQSS